MRYKIEPKTSLARLIIINQIKPLMISLDYPLILENKFDKQEIPNPNQFHNNINKNLIKIHDNLNIRYSNNNWNWE